MTATKTAPKFYPAPGQLSTPTDLAPDKVQAIVEALNPIIADLFALYVKTKNFHWHLSGSHFRDYHLMFDKQATVLLETIDPLAERVRKLGGTTIRSISNISATQTLGDDNDDFVAPLDMLRRLMADNQKLAHDQRSAHEVCEDGGDVATASLLETYIDEAERRTWFLFEAAQGGDNTR